MPFSGKDGPTEIKDHLTHLVEPLFIYRFPRSRGILPHKKAPLPCRLSLGCQENWAPPTSKRPLFSPVVRVATPPSLATSYALDICGSILGAPYLCAAWAFIKQCPLNAAQLHSFLTEQTAEWTILGIVASKAATCHVAAFSAEGKNQVMFTLLPTPYVLPQRYVHKQRWAGIQRVSVLGRVLRTV